MCGPWCTARLVCAPFHAAASRCLHSIRLSAKYLRRHPDTSFSTFPKLGQVTICDVGEEDMSVLAQAPVAHAVTHLSLVHHTLLPWVTAAPPALPLLPKLISLTVVSYTFHRGFPLPLTLKELSLGNPVAFSDAEAVTLLTQLTSLRINITGDRNMPFEALTALTALQQLGIGAEVSVLPSVAELSLFTHLCYWMRSTTHPPQRLELAPLTRLHKLERLELRTIAPDLTPPQLKAVGAITTLKSLDLILSQAPDRTALDVLFSTPFSRLAITDYQQDYSFLPRFKIEGLQELRLHLGDLSLDVVVGLGRATGLTQLEVSYVRGGAGVGPEDVGLALSRMSRLQALSLENYGSSVPPCTEFISLLTGLTSLEWGASYVTNAVLEACLCLKKLRTLSLLPQSPAVSDRVTPDMFFAVAKLPELSALDMTEMFGTEPPFRLSDQDLVMFNAYRQSYGWPLFGSLRNPFGLTDEIKAMLDAERHSRGWPPLRLTLKDFFFYNPAGAATYALVVLRWGFE